MPTGVAVFPREVALSIRHLAERTQYRRSHTEPAEKLAQIPNEQGGYFHGREIAAAVEFRLVRRNR